MDLTRLVQCASCDVGSEAGVRPFGDERFLGTVEGA
jgi:hypothetical protein